MSEGVDLFDQSEILGVRLAVLDSRAQVTSEQGVVTTRNTSDPGAFVDAFLAAIAEHRHWIRLAQKDMVPA